MNSTFDGSTIPRNTPTRTPRPLGSATLPNTPLPVGTSTLPAPSLVPTVAAGGGVTVINYEYDPLYRLTSAEYSTGEFYHYTYDSVGNRLTSSDQSTVTSYQYDDANRLTTVLGPSSSVQYTFDANGNLLSDGVNTYVYDSANRLISVNGTSLYGYNGLGDRLSQTVDGVQTNYTLDLNPSTGSGGAAGLTQVLADGTNTYTYGLGRVSQSSIVNQQSEIAYFLGDALGSVRQLVDNTSEVTLTKSYDPYGNVIQSTGSGTSPFAYTGEATDANGLTYLRARYYASDTGRFLSRDTWGGDVNSPMSMNRWNYVNGNPVNYTDPIGLTPLRLGYVEGTSYAAGILDGNIQGKEIVYDYATMTRARFNYSGTVGGAFASIGAAIYVGGITGFRYEPKALPIGLNLQNDLNLPRSKLIDDDYKGDFDGAYAGGSVTLVKPFVGVTAGLGYFQSSDGSIKGGFEYLSASAGVPMSFEAVGFHTTYDIDRSGIEYYYDTKTGLVNRGKLISDILTGNHSPVGAAFSLLGNIGGARNSQIGTALLAANLFEKYYYQPQYGQCRSGQPDPQPVQPLPDPFQIPMP